MPLSKPWALRERVLIYIPAGPDQILAEAVLQQEQYRPQFCPETSDLILALQEGCGALVIDEGSLTSELFSYLSRFLHTQPPWSDLPILILAESDGTTDFTHRFEPLGNITLLSCPLRADAFLSAIRSAIRARRKQYEIAGYLKERDQLLHRIRDSERIYRGIGESMKYGIWVSDPNGKFVYLSNSMLELVGRTQEQVHEEGWLTYIHADDRSSVIDLWRETISTGNFWDVVARVKGVDGNHHPILTRGAPIRGDNNEVVCWAGINLDISREKGTEEALQTANAALRSTNADMEQFIHVAIHDLREPLRNIALYTQMFDRYYKGRLDVRADEMIAILNRSARRMEALIRDLIIYTKTSRINLEPSSPVSVGNVVRKVLNSMGPTVEALGAKVTWDELPDVPMQEVHLEQLLHNLLDNALKYHGKDAPCVHISAAIDGAESTPAWHFRIEDNGIGIDPAYTTHIFGLFRRLHSESEYPGTGVGLPICQRIIERYGGRIWVNSAPGSGSTFHFTLPAAA